MKQILIIFLVMAFFVIGCTNNDSNQNSSNLPQSRAGEGEVLVVMDSTLWQGELGESIRNTFASYIPGLPQPEPIFNLKYIRPAGFKSIIRHATSVIIVMTLDNKSREGEALRNYFTDESLERIQNSDELYMLKQNDVFARGQSVLYLFGQNEQQLISHINANENSLKQHFLKNEKNRISQKIFAGKGSEGIQRKLLNDHQFSLKVPSTYEIAKEEGNFIWLRQLGQDDKSIMVYYEPYVSAGVFEEQGVLELRDSIASTYIKDIENPDIYVVTETVELPPHLERINLNGKYAVESRGLWKLNDNSRGGAFISYTFVDEELNRLYYIEGMLANPGRNKREPIRELEIILNTFKTQAELQKQSS